MLILAPLILRVAARAHQDNMNAPSAVSLPLVLVRPLACRFSTTRLALANKGFAQRVQALSGRGPGTRTTRWPWTRWARTRGKRYDALNDDTCVRSWVGSDSCYNEQGLRLVLGGEFSLYFGMYFLLFRCYSKFSAHDSFEVCSDFYLPSI